MTGKRAPRPRLVAELPADDEVVPWGEDRAGPPPRRASGEYLRAVPGRWELDDGPVSASPGTPHVETRMLDDEISFEACDGPSALDLSSIRPASGARAQVRMMLRPPSGGAHESIELDSAALVARPPRDAVAAFAGYPRSPSTLFEAPLYALEVIRRRSALRRSLTDARARCSPDVQLYEAAVAAADDGAVRRGIFVALAMVFCACIGAFVFGEATGLSDLLP